ncbi:cytochrome C oxidase subunit IV family protein [Luteolibacter soli]|uniref:Cytochrome C oxidase subunit IV family protein n=1 Tax=Luteolibacter soli TaxID=3135280 RepID=A0ABU9B3R6_9BACT
MTEPARSNQEAVRRTLRLYAFVGLLLFCGTAATVAVATVPWLDVGKHGFDTADMCLGLLIATIKASLVAAIFMHLNHERRLVYWLVGLAFVHCAGMIAFTMLAEADSIRDPYFFHGERKPDKGGVPVSRGPFPQTDTTPKPDKWVGP